MQEMLSTLNLLQEQHQEIQRRIEALEQSIFKTPERGIAADILSLIDYVHHHHELEETKLFPFVSTQEWLNHGGPRCGFFMGQIMDLKIHERFANTLRKHGYTAFRQNRDWLTGSSPLWVPLDEHDLGTAFSTAIKSELKKGEVPAKNSALQDLVLGYLELVSVHRQKEDECLFVLIRQKLETR